MSNLKLTQCSATFQDPTDPQLSIVVGLQQGAPYLNISLPRTEYPNVRLSHDDVARLARFMDTVFNAGSWS